MYGYLSIFKVEYVPLALVFLLKYVRLHIFTHVDILASYLCHNVYL